MKVLKRNGRLENVYFDKITARVAKLCYGLDPKYVDPTKITRRAVSGVYDGVSTVELDNLAAEIAANMISKHPDYGTLAARIAISNLHKETKKQFSTVINDLYNYHSEHTNEHRPMISKETFDIVQENANVLDSAIIYNRDFDFNYFGFRTLERSYLLRINKDIVERPQHMFMRVAIGIHGNDLDKAIETYNLMSQKFFIHASPTLFNAGTPRPQLSSCFLLTMKEDSIDGIYETLKNCALISKTAGGIGLNVHCIRSAGSYISGTNGLSNGVVPMLRVFNNTARYVDQGGNKRPGAFAIYMEPWHADVQDFLELKKNTGAEEQRARDLFYAMWTPDLFMKRVKNDGMWSLFCPNDVPGLHDTYGEEFEALYEKYEKEGRARKVIKAQHLWQQILESQIETGTPYMLYKDACNRKSNQKNLGTIKSSNLCTEIVEYTSPDEIAVCNLASLGLPTYVRDGVFDYDQLHKVTKVVTRNLNKIIDVNHYPVKEARNSNMRHRPIGLGVQGLADTFIKMRLPFASDEAKELNKRIFETIYHAALETSVELAKEEGHYKTFEGSPISEGILQFDFWRRDGKMPSSPDEDSDLQWKWDWNKIRADVVEHGVRNSLLVAPMPTASTSQILGFNECFEPYTSNMYSRQVLAGTFQVVNPHLLRELTDRGLWNDRMKNNLMRNRGSVQGVPGIPADIQEIYKTVWEIPQRHIIDMAADRGQFIDQSQSMNIHMGETTYAKLTSMHFHGWKKGLKTGMYYLRTRPARDAIQFTVEKEVKTTEAMPNGLPNEKPNVVNGINGKPNGVNGLSDEDSSSESTDSDETAIEMREPERRMCPIEGAEGCLMCSG